MSGGGAEKRSGEENVRVKTVKWLCGASLCPLESWSSGSSALLSALIPAALNAFVRIVQRTLARQSAAALEV